ncbi:MAG: chemotaxis protein CheW [Deferrisomatales bacterium]
MPTPTDDHTSEDRQLVTFRVGEEEFGVDILSVREIHRVMDVTRVPHAPEFVDGVVNLRGQVVPVVDLRKRFGLEPAAPGRSTRIVVVELGTVVVGFLVDAVCQVRRVAADALDAPPPLVAGLAREYIEAVARVEDGLLILLDLRRLLDRREADELRSLGA